MSLFVPAQSNLQRQCSDSPCMHVYWPHEHARTHTHTGLTNAILSLIISKLSYRLNKGLRNVLVSARCLEHFDDLVHVVRIRLQAAPPFNTPNLASVPRVWSNHSVKREHKRKPFNPSRVCRTPQSSMYAYVAYFEIPHAPCAALSAPLCSAGSLQRPCR